MERTARPVARSLRCSRHERIALPLRTFSSTTPSLAETNTELPSASQPPPPPPSSRPRTLDPEKVSRPALERRLVLETGKSPIGSRRRRLLLTQTKNTPFEQLPYQCFQEARKVLQEDREEKLKEIQKQRWRIEQRSETKVAPEDEYKKEHRLRSMKHRLEQTKILADINDPVVKRNFEDGLGDMNKPIYRHLALKKWESYKRPLLMQRITQMSIIPDILPKIEPSISTTLFFGRRKVQHGDIVDSRVSEITPYMKLQPYDKGERLCTIAVVDPDVPNVEQDAFKYRCHFLAANVRISPTETGVHFGQLSEETQVIMPWLPPFSQKGLPYQRLGIFILEQPGRTKEGGECAPLDVAAIKKEGLFSDRDTFSLRRFRTAERLEPVGVDLFRTVYDEGTYGVMQRAGVPGADVEFKRMRVEPLPYKKLSGERYR